MILDLSKSLRMRSVICRKALHIEVFLFDEEGYQRTRVIVLVLEDSNDLAIPADCAVFPIHFEVFGDFFHAPNIASENPIVKCRGI